MKLIAPNAEILELLVIAFNDSVADLDNTIDVDGLTISLDMVELDMMIDGLDYKILMNDKLFRGPEVLVVREQLMQTFNKANPYLTVHLKGDANG